MAGDGAPATGFARVRAVFEAALEVPASERPALLDRECVGPDGAAVRREVEELLRCDTDAGDVGSLLDRGADALVDELVGAGAPTVGARVGAFTLKGVLGSGGMGTVYEAEQDEPRRRVALKVLSLALASEQAVRRFRWEAEVLANLRHPGIAQVHAVGVHRAGDIELPWFAMELVPDAQDLVGYARARSLSRRERIELFLQVCDAVHHGHLQGVVHRDLKPQNVLVDGDGRARVIDFGVARSMAADAQLTEGGVALGTLHYMSPEQLRGRAVDLRSDIFSLGVVLFELLAGRRPFEFAETTPLVVAETLEQKDAARLSAVVPGVARDLEVVLQKALRRDADERYASAAEFADDLRAFLDERPVRARAPSTFYQVRMFARRRRGLVASLGVIFVLVVVALVVVLAQNAELERQGRTLRENNEQLAASERALQERNRSLADRERRLQRQNTELERRGRVSRRIAAFARDFLDESSLMSARGLDYTVREALDVAASNLAHETFEDAETEASLRDLVGTTYRGLSLPRTAEPHLVRARELWLGLEGPDSRRAVGTGVSLVVALREQGRDEEAERLIDELVATFPAEGRDDDPLWWRVQHNRAYVLRHLGRLHDAEALYLDVLAARERLLGDDAPETVATMHNLGTLRLALRDPEGARDVLAEAAARASRAAHPPASTLQIVDNLAEAWRELGDLDRAAAKHREAMVGFEELVGPDHQLTIGCGYHLLKTLYKQGDARALDELATDLLQRCERTFGPDDYRTMDVLQALAAAKGQLGAPREAAALMRRAYDAVVRLQGDGHPGAFNAGHNLTMAYLGAGDPDGALAVTAALTARLEQGDVQLPPIFPGLTWLLRARATAAAQDEAATRAAAARAVEAFDGVLDDGHPLLDEARGLAGTR